ncbi:MAG: class I SAM-dependent methyltransferase [Candidatus Aenigmarchaeota archaeon]|nr:class I SAM-dependent methyltransferase [Candidatus Aenigmarchaeota archaeon]
MKAKLKFRTKKEVLDEYENVALSYDLDRSGNFEGRLMDRIQRQLIYGIIERNNFKKVLEAGCGTGRILLYLAFKGLECHGIDPSRNMLSQFKRKTGKYDIDVQLKVGDIEDMPYGQNTFDCTFTMHVLMHLPDYKKAFKEMYRVTKKNGIVICDFPNENSPWTKLSMFIEPNRERTRLFTIQELKEFFNGYDYEMTGVFSYARTFYKIPIIQHAVAFLENFLPLPLWFRRHLFVIVRKR